MQRPPLRHRLSTPRTVPIPPGLLDSPYLQSPNSPYRRIDHRIVVVGSSTGGGASSTSSSQLPPPKPCLDAAQLNLLDTVPMGASQKEYEEATARYRKELSMGTLGMGSPPPPSTSPTSASSPRTRKGSNGHVGTFELQLQQQDGSGSGLGRTPSTRSTGGSGSGGRPPYMRESSWYLYLQKDQAARDQAMAEARHFPPSSSSTTMATGSTQSRRSSMQPPQQHHPHHIPQAPPQSQSPMKRPAASTSVPNYPPTSAAR
ncbi:hypothetical protein FRB96_007203 [Tulasnella sp. 330]|nr:hypothetical protein FRB96_007203 [Tulasnella sp. 330]KAG8873524.1 hypothetical protein FRB97_006653 [Tulasnella sp. 331]